MKAMPLCSLLLGTFLFVAPAWGGAGDSLYVQGDAVNVREQPDTKAPVVLQLDRGQLLFELQRRGDWVNVAIDGSGGQDGWVYGALVTPTAPPGDALPAADPRFERFRAGVFEMNAKADRASGTNRFTAAGDLGDGIVRVTATEDWVALPEAERQNDMDALFDLWDVAEGTGLPIMVQVVNRDGQVVMTRARR